MFNLSTPGNVGYNGISQLSETRCPAEDVYTFREVEPSRSPAARLRTCNGTLNGHPHGYPHGQPHSNSNNQPHHSVQTEVFQPGRLSLKRRPSPAVSDTGQNRTKNSIISYGTVGRSREPPPESPSESSPESGGRGPALHEALQRISGLAGYASTRQTPLRRAFPRHMPFQRALAWHAPAARLLDLAPVPSGSADDDDCSQTHAMWRWEEADCAGRARRLAVRRAALRRRVSQLQRHSECLQLPAKGTALCGSVRAQVQGGEGRGRALLGPSGVLEVLSAHGGPSLVSAVERRRLRCGSIGGGGICSVSGCEAAVLACARMCLAHITHSPEQRLFSECTAKFSDNTQCRRPVLNIAHQLPLCAEHAWKRDNYDKMNREPKPKKAPRKRPKPSAMIRPQKRSRRRRRGPPACPSPADDASGAPEGPEEPRGPGERLSSPTPYTDSSLALPELNVCSTSSAGDSSEEAGTGGGGLSESEFITVTDPARHSVDSAAVDQVLGMAPTAPEPALDLNTVFSDFFAVEPNGEYIPTHEETEELERALEAVNQDVKSLEKLTGSQHTLLDSLLDETLASLPDVFSPRAPPS